MLIDHRARETITPCFGTPIHPVWRAVSCSRRNWHFPHPCGSCCENLKDTEYYCVSARHTWMYKCRLRLDAGCDPCQTGASTPQNSWTYYFSSPKKRLRWGNGNRGGWLCEAELNQTFGLLLNMHTKHILTQANAGSLLMKSAVLPAT